MESSLGCGVLVPTTPLTSAASASLWTVWWGHLGWNLRLILGCLSSMQALVVSIENAAKIYVIGLRPSMIVWAASLSVCEAAQDHVRQCSARKMLCLQPAP